MSFDTGDARCVNKVVDAQTLDERIIREVVSVLRSSLSLVFFDSAYWGTGCVVPHRKRTGRPLLPAQEADNTEHRRVRARVEHTFARMKNYKILRDCRCKGNGLHTAVQAVATMHNLAVAA